jgi:hypothetical protein
MSIGTLTAVHVIGKCPIRGCKSRRRHTFDGEIREDRYRKWTYWTIPTAGGPMNAHATFAPARLDYLPANEPWQVQWADGMKDLGWFCETHQWFMTPVTVRGTVNEMKPCSARCASATGPSCECVCGGERHGATWS